MRVGLITITVHLLPEVKKTLFLDFNIIGYIHVDSLYGVRIVPFSKPLIVRTSQLHTTLIRAETHVPIADTQMHITQSYM